ncbi:ATP-binding protein [Microbacterium rhizomatis]|uniref:ATP-binding protein n=1 Tax=Microbacterium rhizomatis TaxID=1631477 RepID=UPI0014782881|nr:BTAD domain-containing putative transcriptional regulator [Microbacterium rhizomatis]
MDSAWPDPPRLAVLGPVRVRRADGAIVEPSGRLAPALLIALAASPATGSATAVSVSALIDDVWGDAAPAGAHQALQTLVSRTRASLPPDLIVSRAQGYALALAQPDIDLGRAILLARDARAHVRAGDHRAALELVGHALALWTGEPGADAGEAPSAADLARRAGSLRDELLSLQAEALVRTGQPEAAAVVLDALVAARPLDEQRVRSLMDALAAAGRRTEALALFASTRVRLRDELGVSPGQALVEANAALLADIDRDETPRVSSVPTAANALIGREADVAAVTALLNRARLVTILGTGGLGKTRLSLEIARGVSIPRVVFVELAGVRAPEDVPLAFASALGVRDVAAARRLGEARPDDRTRILGSLRDRATLLVIDNCEHVIDSASGWVADLLSEVGDLRVLTTTRTPLDISGEHIYALEPLGSDTVDGDIPPAIRLFIERARAARSDVHLPVDIVGRLCARLDGLPLAIELAAARVRTMSVDEIEARLVDRFALLTTGSRNAPDRHRTLRAVVEWSWDLLGEDARDAFCVLAVFPDGFSGDTAHAVLGDSIDIVSVLDSLVTQSLMSARDSPDTGMVRFRMLETMREFGLAELERRGSIDDAVQRVIEWADRMSRSLLSRWSGPDQPAVIARTQADQENLLFALRAAIARTDPSATSGIFALIACMLTVTDGHADVAAFAPQVTAVTAGWTPDDDHAAAAVIGMLIAAVTAGITSDVRVALRARARLVRWLRAEVPLPSAIAAAARVVSGVRRPEQAPALLADLALSDDPATALVGTLMSGQIAENSGDTPAARQFYLAAWELASRRGDVWVAAMCAGSLAAIEVQAGAVESAMEWVEESSKGMALLRIGAAYSEWTRALVLIAGSRHLEARAVLERLQDSADARARQAEFLAVAHLGLAELARIEQAVDLASAEYRAARHAIDQEMGIPNPWRLIILAWGAIAARTTDGLLPHDEWVRDGDVLRALTLELAAVRSGMIDLPVLGVAVLGIAASESPIATGDPARTAELVALAERLGPRADLPLLRVDAFIQDLEARGWDLHSAREAASTLTREEAAARAIAMIAERPLPES